MLVFQPSAIHWSTSGNSYSLQSSGSVDFSDVLRCRYTLQLCQVGRGSLADIFRSPQRCLNGFKTGSRLSQSEVLRTPDQFFIKYISVLCSVLLSLDPDQSPQPSCWKTPAWCCHHQTEVMVDFWPSGTFFHLHTGPLQLNHWAHGHLSDWEIFSPDFSVQSDSRLWERVLVLPKLLPFQIDGGYGDLGDLQCSRNVFVAFPGLFSAWTQSRLWALEESLNPKVWILCLTFFIKCVVWLFKHSFSYQVITSHVSSCVTAPSQKYIGLPIGKKPLNQYLFLDFLTSSSVGLMIINYCASFCVANSQNSVGTASFSVQLLVLQVEVGRKSYCCFSLENGILVEMAFVLEEKRCRKIFPDVGKPQNYLVIKWRELENEWRCRASSPAKCTA